VLKTINAIQQKFGQPPLTVADDKQKVESKNLQPETTLTFYLCPLTRHLAMPTLYLFARGAET